MTAAAPKTLTPVEIAFAYHRRTKHTLEKYAPGPETLDWDDQPNPYREFEGAPRTLLPFTSEQIAADLEQVYAPAGMAPAPLNLGSVSALLELAMGLSAWKEYGPDKWALRANPSSGNLHPTEAYVVSSGVSGLDNGLYHYVSREHALEQRCLRNVSSGGPPRLLVGLTSIHWREAWKYGERAFRYCQLDIGHALGAFRYAAGALGWSAKVLSAVGSAEIKAVLGLDRSADYAGVELEDPELLIAIDPHPPRSALLHAVPDLSPGDPENWAGRANRIDRHPLYRWPIIDQVSVATLGRNTTPPSQPRHYPPLMVGPQGKAADIILNRRSAQRFDAKAHMSGAAFYRMLDTLLARPVAPWDVWDFTPSLHPVLLVHRVEGLQPGVYALPRRPEAVDTLRQAMRSDFEWKAPEGAPEHLPLYRLLPADCRSIAKMVSCHQAIASDGCFAVSMLSEFEGNVEANPWRYRQLHWEAGLIGHVLYLEAEAAGLRGTGIGCYFDDALHSLLGIEGLQLQALYHFTVGRPVTDSRITTLPAYPDRQERRPTT